jgi:hypothetical protein
MSHVGATRSERAFPAIKRRDGATAPDAGTAADAARLPGDRYEPGRANFACKPATSLTETQRVGTALTMIGGAAAVTTGFFAWVGAISPILPIPAVAVAVVGFAMVLTGGPHPADAGRRGAPPA